MVPRPCAAALVGALVVLVLTGCGGQHEPSVANPASEDCDAQGGTVEIRSDASGDQHGACVFDDGSECDEWAYYRGECQPGEEP
jgi:putative hemolysin